MVEVQPPPEWQDATGDVPSHSAPAPPSADSSSVLGEAVATGNRWIVPSIAVGALLCTGLLSWVVWSQLREPDRAEPQPIVAATPPQPDQVKTPPGDEAETAPSPKLPKIVKEQTQAAPTPAAIDPPTAVVNPVQQPVEQAPLATVTLPKENESAPLELAPPKPKLVLKPEQSPPAQPEAPLFARGPEVNPNGATQAVPAGEVEEKPVFNKPLEAVTPAVVPVVPPQVAAAPLPRTPLSAVNPKHLELTLASVTYDQVPLYAFLREMGRLADAEIGIDDEILQRSGWRFNTPIRVQLQNVTVRGALQSALRPLELDLIVKDNYLWIGHAAAAETTHLTRYPIDDLVNKASPDTDAAELAAQAQRVVAPERWAAGKLDIVPGAFLVTQSAFVHDELIVWFEKLRIARGLPLRTKYDPANAQLRRFAPQRFAMTTHWQLAEPLLSKPVTASFLQPESLGEILDVLQRQTQAVVIWDLPALDAAGLSPDTLATFSVNDARLEQAVEQLLEHSGLTFVPLDETNLLVTTKTAAARRMLTERYSLGRLLEQRRWEDDEDAVAAGFRQELVARGLELPQTMPLAWDRVSRTLAVSTSPQTHRAIEKILGELQQKPVAATAVIKK